MNTPIKNRKMKNVKIKLTILFWLFLLPPAILYVTFDLMDYEMAYQAESGSQTLFVVSTAMILLTLALIPLALRLFSFGKVEDDLLLREDKGLMKWGSLRLAILGGLLYANTQLYYLFDFEPAFGYLAIVTLLTFPFVYPTMKRCLAETGLDEVEEETPAPNTIVKEEEQAE